MRKVETPAKPSRTLPGPGPSGWYVVAVSSEVAPGAHVTRPFHGGEVVVFRTESGRVVVSRPFCPHLGAHLGRTGRVEGETVRCAFHGFRFGPDGQCVAAYPGGRAPPTCRLSTFPARDKNGLVVAFYDPSGAAPTWEVPDLDGAGYRPTLFRSWNIAGHPQETSENSVDVGHFAFVHGYESVAALEPVVTEGPLLRGKYTMRRRRAGLSRAITIDISLQVWGLGYSVVDVHVRDFDLRARHFVLSTPAQEGRIDLRIGLALRRVARRAIHPLAALAPRRILEPLIERAVLAGYAADVEQDFKIWEHKTYLPRPSLAEGDGPVGLYRKWASQFYPVGDGASAG
jgi:nitrite reductase/ring-hydroxylating ferredoxin subunit